MTAGVPGGAHSLPALPGVCSPAFQTRTRAFFSFQAECTLFAGNWNEVTREQPPCPPGRVGASGWCVGTGDREVNGGGGRGAPAGRGGGGQAGSLPASARQAVTASKPGADVSTQMPLPGGRGLGDPPFQSCLTPAHKLRALTSALLAHQSSGHRCPPPPQASSGSSIWGIPGVG